MSKKYPKAPKHGTIEEIFQNVFLVSGSVNMIPGVRLSRNMIIGRCIKCNAVEKPQSVLKIIKEELKPFIPLGF